MSVLWYGRITVKIRKGSLNYWVFTALAEAAEGLEVFSYSKQMRFILNLPSKVKEDSVATAIRRLRKNGLIEQEKSDEGKRVLKLTQIGRDFLGEEEKWDGKYRIVIWDIPEKKRRLRDLFRRRLKDWEFKRWQKSVWVSKKNVTDKLRKLIADLEMEEWVVVIESDDPTLAQLFRT